MEKKTIDTLRAMVCGELEDIAKQGKLTHETLDILKDLTETEKNLGKISHYQKEEEQEEIRKMSEMDRGYSQRKYYIDADYQPGMGMSYRGGNSYMDGNSYARGGRSMYDMDGGNSYMYYDPRFDNRMYSRMGYSRTSKEDMVEELRKMMKETSDEKMKTAINEVINRMGM